MSWWLGVFIGFFFGGIFGVGLMAIFQANRNLEDKYRADHATKMAEEYKEKYFKLKNESTMQ